MRAFLKSQSLSKALHCRTARENTAWAGILAILALACSTAGAQEIQINSSPNFVGSGARAQGMGGAFIAVADDATAASWNPAGLAQLERPEVSLVYNLFWREESFDDTGSLWLDGEGVVSLDNLNYASVVYPLPVAPWGRNIVLSFNYQRRYDFNRELRGSVRDYTGLPFGDVLGTRADYEFTAKGSLNAVTPAASIELTKTLSIGFAANFFRSGLGENGWSTENAQLVSTDLNGVPSGRSKIVIKDDFEDVNGTSYTAGVLWAPNQKLSIGAVYHSAMKMRYSQFTTTRLYSYPDWDGAQLEFLRLATTQRWRTEFPASFGLGVAYRVNDRLTISVDATRRMWSDFISVRLGGTSEGPPVGQRLSSITGLPAARSDVDDVYTLRAGAEYVFANPNQFLQRYLPTLRAGAFYDPEPSNGKPDPVYGITFGAGVLIHDRVNIDLAYQYRFGEGIRGDTYGLEFGRDLARGDVAQHELLLSTVIYF